MPLKGDYSENSHVVFCPNKQRCFEPFNCSDLIFEGWQFSPRIVTCNQKHDYKDINVNGISHATVNYTH